MNKEVQQPIHHHSNSHPLETEPVDRDRMVAIDDVDINVSLPHRDKRLKSCIGGDFENGCNNSNNVLKNNDDENSLKKDNVPSVALHSTPQSVAKNTQSNNDRQLLLTDMFDSIYETVNKHNPKQEDVRVESDYIPQDEVRCIDNRKESLTSTFDSFVSAVQNADRPPLEDRQQHTTYELRSEDCGHTVLELDDDDEEELDNDLIATLDSAIKENTALKEQLVLLKRKYEELLVATNGGITSTTSGGLTNFNGVKPSGTIVSLKAVKPIIQKYYDEHCVEGFLPWRQEENIRQLIKKEHAKLDIRHYYANKLMNDKQLKGYIYRLSDMYREVINVQTSIKEAKKKTISNEILSTLAVHPLIEPGSVPAAYVIQGIFVSGPFRSRVHFILLTLC